MNSIHEVVYDAPSYILLCNLSTQERNFSKSTVVTFAARSLIGLISLSGTGAQNLCDMIENLPTIASEQSLQKCSYQSRSDI